jgi:hypothetical protein
MAFINDSDTDFYSQFRTYKIIKGDTLQSVAQKLRIEDRELRRYHNTYCKIPDLIESGFKPFTKFLILAPEKAEGSLDVVVEKETRKVIFANDYRLPFIPRGISKDYSVKYIFKIGSQIDKMEMGVNVSWLATDQNKYHLFEIRKSVNLFIDNSEPDRIMDAMGAQIVQVLYPLKIVVDDSGKWIDIHNYDEIVNRWQNKKRKLLEYYKKGIVPKYLEESELALISSATLLESLNSDYFLRSFFNGIHLKHTSDLVCDLEVFFPLEKNKEPRFQIQQKVDAYLDKSSLIRVEQKGDYININNDTNLGNHLFDGKFYSSYLLNPHSYFIENMYLECNVDFNKAIKLTIKMDALKK